MTFLLAALLQVGAALPADSVETLRDRARSAEARYERLARSTAPFSWGGGAVARCDEYVGRFCIYFDSVSPQPSAAEHEDVGAARREAIESARRYFSAAPSERGAAGPLVRLLVHDGRPREAASAAGAFAALSRDSLWGPLLLGFAEHAAGSDSSATEQFRSALARMDAATREQWQSPEWLLQREERRRYGRLRGEARESYDARLWALADPFWLTPANERWVEHMARHTESELLRTVPFVAGMTSWGDDIHELTVRYGTPTARSRENGPVVMPNSSLVEYWDSTSRSYVPDRLSRGYPTQPAPDEKPLFYAATARAGYAWHGVSRVLELPHQVTRFSDGPNVVVRVDATVRADTGTARGMLRAALFLADTMLSTRRETRTALTWQGDSVRVRLLATTPPGPVYYSVEALDPVADVAARARYALAAQPPPHRPWLSDILICHPFPAGVQPVRFDDEALRARSSVAVARADTLGVYAEVYGLAGRGAQSLSVELSLERADAPSVVRRFFEWMGRSVGLVAPATEPRVAWRAEATGGVHTLSLNLPLDERLSGRYVLVLRVTDAVSGTTAESRRLIVIG